MVSLVHKHGKLLVRVQFIKPMGTTFIIFSSGKLSALVGQNAGPRKIRRPVNLHGINADSASDACSCNTTNWMEQALKVH